MKKIWESTRDKEVSKTASEAILKGLSEEGGLFVMRDLEQAHLDVEKMLDMSYQEIAISILRILLDDFSDEEIAMCVNKAYDHRFRDAAITPLTLIGDDAILELFGGPTSAFKDIGLSLLPQLMSTALKKSQSDDDILILTATSGDTGKAALEGFKDADRIKIIVFYPFGKVSAVQQAQMQTQEGKNLAVCALRGNFDDAQNGIKQLFVDESFKKSLKQRHIALSSANSINIGRLIPQMVYYFYAYIELVRKHKIKMGEAINFVVPTGNFGNILAGYYAKLLGLPVHKFIVAANNNNVLYDFINTGVYDRNRDFLKTISPSMDILISSNLERLLYYLSDKDNKLVKELMEQLKEQGRYEVSKALLEKIQEHFSAGYATDKETSDTIKKVYEKYGYLLDTHTAVAYRVMQKKKEEGYMHVVLSTASPYKFTQSVYASLYGKTHEDEFLLMEKLHQKTKAEIPLNLSELNKKAILHDKCIDKKDMKQYILETLEEIK